MFLGFVFIICVYSGMNYLATLQSFISSDSNSFLNNCIGFIFKAMCTHTQ